MSSAAWQEIRVGMTKGRATLPWKVVAGQKALFITLGGPQAHDHSGRDDNSVWEHYASFPSYIVISTEA
jgi:hypothetical protein